MAEYHNLDIKPIPESVLYINENLLADISASDIELTSEQMRTPDTQDDNVRIYIPLDLNQSAIIRRLMHIFAMLGDVSEKNELHYSREVDRIISQLEIYDQIWFIREGDCEVSHSHKATLLAKEIIGILHENEGMGELFPYEHIEDLRREYGLQSEDND